MNTFPEKIQDFLRQKNIAVTGVSSTNPDAANLIFNKFKNAEYAVYAVNPNAKTVEGVQAYPDLAAIQTKPDGVVIASPPQSAKSIIDECLSLNISRIWFHSSINQGSLDKKAADYAEEKGLSVIRTGCPMMYIPPVDFPHKCIKWVLGLTGKIPSK